MCLNFSRTTHIFTQCISIQFYGKAEVCEIGRFSLSGSHVNLFGRVAKRNQKPRKSVTDYANLTMSFLRFGLIISTEIFGPLYSA